LKFEHWWGARTVVRGRARPALFLLFGREWCIILYILCRDSPSGCCCCCSSGEQCEHDRKSRFVRPNCCNGWRRKWPNRDGGVLCKCHWRLLALTSSQRNGARFRLIVESTSRHGRSLRARASACKQLHPRQTQHSNKKTS